MDIKLNLTFAPVYQNKDNEDRIYQIGKFRELNIYGVQVQDKTGKASGNAALLGGTDIVLMGLTEEEFLLKDTDKNKLKELVDKLVKELPKDRLISFKQLNYKGEMSQTEVKPRCETVDDGKYAKFVQSTAVYIPDDLSVVVNADYYLAANFFGRANSIVKEKRTPETEEKIGQIKTIVMKKLKAMPEFFCMYNKSLGNRYPTIGPNGAVWIFTMEELAKEVISKNEGIDFAYQKISSQDFLKLAADMYRMGMTEILFNPGFDFAFLIERDVYMPVKGYEGTSVTNSDLHYMFIRFLQNKRVDNKNCQNTANMLWNIINQKIPESIFLAPMLLEGETPEENKDDMKLYYTPKAAELAEKIKINFFGMEKYDTNPKSSDEKMQYLTLKSKDKDGKEIMWLPLFTDIAELKSIFSDKVRICAITFGEAVSVSMQNHGICINPTGVNLCMETNKATEEEIQNMKKKPEENEASPQTAPTAEEASEENQPQKTSILKKIFGKDKN